MNILDFDKASDEEVMDLYIDLDKKISQMVTLSAEEMDNFIKAKEVVDFRGLNVKVKERRNNRDNK